MNLSRFTFQSLVHYRGINLAVLGGVVLTSAILSGALVVGDSVKESLRQNSAARISGAGPILVGGERFLTVDLAERVATGLDSPDSVVAPLLQVEGTVAARNEGRRANRVQIVGVDDRFWLLSRAGSPPEELAGDDWMAVNRPLADRLGAETGSTLIVRVEIPGQISKDAPLSGESEQTVPFTEKITTVVGSDHFGRYSLRAEQVPAPTIFVPISQLQETLELPDKANVFLGSRAIDPESFASAVESQWQLSDIALSLAPLADSPRSQLLSERVFFDAPTVAAVRGVDETATPILTYLANDIVADGGATPYSMVGGAVPGSTPLVPEDLEEGEIVISDWLADDLGAGLGDTLTLEYYAMETGRQLVEKSAAFVDRDRIRQKDEDYWDTYRATPKAFLSLADARKLWANRFGDTTAVRLAGPGNTGSAAFADSLREKLDLPSLGIAFRDLAAEAEGAVAQSFDFGQLFAYMSFFLILSALVLAGLVFVFGIEQRSSQVGLLLALGFTRGRVRRLFLREAALLSVAGGLLGLAVGWLYTRLALVGMSGAWRKAAAGIEFVYHVRIVSLAVAFLLTVLFALGAVWLASRRIMAFQPSELITGSEDLGGGRRTSWWARFRDVTGIAASLAGGLGCLFAPKLPGSMAEQGLFFGAGFLFTLAGVFASSLLIGRLGKPAPTLTSLAALGRQHTVRRRGRSLAVIGLMAAGVFMVTAINSFRLEGSRGADRRDSGTGGFAWVGESTLPVYEDLNSVQGREKHGLDSVTESPGEVDLLSLRVSDGDDASCLNLNRAQRPRIMAVAAGRIAALDPFSFTAVEGTHESSPWEVLTAPPSEEDGVPVIPGVVDQNTAAYALQLGLGDTIAYQSAAGDPFRVRIAGLLATSILQGNIVIAEDAFLRLYPDAGGYRYFLLDSPDPEKADATAAHLTRMFGDLGLAMRPASDRLNDFNAVQNTYLSIFSTLGGLGVLLGTVGLAIIVGRNVLERRGQLGVMQAMGFTRRSLAGMVLAEHWFLHASGVLLGLLAAAIAVIPKLQGGLAGIPLGLLAGLNGAILTGGLVFCWLAARVVVRGELMDDLRRE